jgi:hypothetical protein
MRGQTRPPTQKDGWYVIPATALRADALNDPSGDGHKAQTAPAWASPSAHPQKGKICDISQSGQGEPLATS